MKRIFYTLLLLFCFGLTACTVANDTDIPSQTPGDGVLSPWRGSFTIELTGNGSQTVTTTLRVTGSEMTFGRLPGVSAPVVAIYLHTGSSDTTEYFDLTQKENPTGPKWVAVYHKKTGLWSGVVVIGGASYQFSATKRTL
ncbi:hypothetical protein JHU38_04645 [Prevotella sp. A2931]|uniref:Lipoprotein n=1 Tax=Prevotella illustrans TaxID=2800387 RepID=A0ABS3M4G9_9BACT|nr:MULTISPECIES: hypothetical protein [Prevotella]MBO1363072.1 hypothetical protein [Prevotella illustrans]PTL26880.1 hypothetical protein C3V39_07450 [Prevotella sp. oral taxon 820]